MTYSQFLRGLRIFCMTLWQEPGSRRVIEFFLILGVGLILVSIFMGNQPYDNNVATVIAALIAAILAIRMSYWNVLNKQPREATRLVVLESTEGVRTRCVEAALSLHYQAGWQSSRHSQHFTRGNPPILPASTVRRDEVFVTLANSKPSMEIKVRTWTKSTIGSSDPADQALQEFVDALQAKSISGARWASAHSRLEATPGRSSESDSNGRREAAAKALNHYKRLINEEFRSSNGFWCSWKELVLAFALLVGAPFLSAMLLLLRIADNASSPNAAILGRAIGNLFGGAFILYLVLIFAPRRRKAWDRAKTAIIQKYGPDKYALINQWVDSRILGTWKEVVVIISLVMIVWLSMKAIVGGVFLDVALAIAVALYFYNFRIRRGKLWDRIGAEIENASRDASVSLPQV